MKGMPGDMNSLIKQAQEMQKELARLDQDADQFKGEGSAGGDMVVVKANGRGEIESIFIKQEVIDPAEAELLQEMIMAATNKAVRIAKEQLREKVTQLTGGLSIPGIF